MAEHNLSRRRLLGTARAVAGAAVLGSGPLVAEHYGVDLDRFPPHAAMLDYVVAAAGG